MSNRLAKALSDVREFADGEYIVRDGDLGEEMFIIQQGTVRISKRMDGREVELNDLGRGEFFSEMSLLESLPRDADARSVGITRVLVLGPGALLLRIRQDPSFALEMLHHLSARTRRLNERLAAVMEGTSALSAHLACRMSLPPPYWTASTRFASAFAVSEDSCARGQQVSGRATQ